MTPADDPVSEDLDSLVDLIAALESLGSVLSLIVVDPLGYAELLSDLAVMPHLPGALCRRPEHQTYDENWLGAIRGLT